MRRLGYQRYGAAGNDAGAQVSPEVGRADKDHVIGVHVTQIFSFPSGDPAEFDGLMASACVTRLRMGSGDRARHLSPGGRGRTRGFAASRTEPTLRGGVGSRPTARPGVNAGPTTAPRHAR